MITKLQASVLSVVYPVMVPESLQKCFRAKIETEHQRLRRATSSWTDEQWSLLSADFKRGDKPLFIKDSSDVLLHVRFFIELQGILFEFYCAADRHSGRRTPLPGARPISLERMFERIEEISVAEGATGLIPAEQSRATHALNAFQEKVESLAQVLSRVDEKLSKLAAEITERKNEAAQLSVKINEKKVEMDQWNEKGDKGRALLDKKREERKTLSRKHEAPGRTVSRAEQNALEQLDQNIQNRVADLRQIEKKYESSKSEYDRLRSVFDALEKEVAKTRAHYQKTASELSRAFDECVYEHSALSSDESVRKEWNRVDRELAKSDKRMKAQLESLKLWHLTPINEQEKKRECRKMLEDLREKMQAAKEHWLSRF